MTRLSRKPRGAGMTVTTICVLLSGCSEPSEVCAGIGTPGFALTVVDAVDRRNLNAEASVTVTDLSNPGHPLTASPSDAGSLAQSAGTYALKVSAPSYLTALDTVRITTTFVGNCPADLVTKPIEVALHRGS